MDTEHPWFRCQPLFGQMLQEQLNRYWSPEEIAALHSWANAWLAENDIKDDWIKHLPTAFREDDATLYRKRLTACRSPTSRWLIP